MISECLLWHLWAWGFFITLSSDQILTQFNLNANCVWCWIQISLSLDRLPVDSSHDQLLTPHLVYHILGSWTLWSVFYLSVPTRDLRNLAEQSLPLFGIIFLHAWFPVSVHWNINQGGHTHVRVQAHLSSTVPDLVEKKPVLCVWNKLDAWSSFWVSPRLATFK